MKDFPTKVGPLNTTYDYINGIKMQGQSVAPEFLYNGDSKKTSPNGKAYQKCRKNRLNKRVSEARRGV